MKPDAPLDCFKETKDSTNSLVELDTPPDPFVEPDPPQCLPVEPDPPPEDPGPPPAPDYGAGPSLEPPGELQPAGNQPPCPDGLDLQFSLVHLGWSRGTLLTMGLLRLVDQWVHNAHLVCGGTRNCTLCSAGASRLQAYSMLEKQAETLIFRKESAKLRNELPPSKLGIFQN